MRNFLKERIFSKSIFIAAKMSQVKAYFDKHF